MRCSLPKAPSWVFWGIGVPSSLPAAQAGDGFHQGWDSFTPVGYMAAFHEGNVGAARVVSQAPFWDVGWDVVWDANWLIICLLMVTTTMHHLIHLVFGNFI